MILICLVGVNALKVPVDISVLAGGGTEEGHTLENVHQIYVRVNLI